MKAIRTHVAGVDVHKDIIVISILVGDADAEPVVHQFECSTFTDDLMKFGLKLKEYGARKLVMESTGVYWKPLYNVWEPMGFDITVASRAREKRCCSRKIGDYPKLIF